LNASHISSFTSFTLNFAAPPVAGTRSVEADFANEGGNAGTGGASVVGGSLDSFLENKLNLRGRFPPVSDRVNFNGAVPSGLSAFVSLDTVGLFDEIELAFVDSSSSRLLLRSSRLLGEGDLEARGELLASPSTLFAPGPELEPPGPKRWYEASPIFSGIFAKFDSVMVGVLGVLGSTSTLSATAASFSQAPGAASRANGDVAGALVALGRTAAAAAIAVVVMPSLGCEPAGKSVFNGGSGGMGSIFCGMTSFSASLLEMLLRRRVDSAGANEFRNENDRVFS
jgi:hypothetical protein